MSGSTDTEPYEVVLAQLQRVPDDQEAWGVLFRLTWPFVLALSHRSLPALRRALDAEDIAQEVYLKFARYWHERRPPLGDRDSLFSLLALITRRLAVDAGRWQNRARRDVARVESESGKEIEDRREELAEFDLRDLLDKVCLILTTEEQQILSLRLQEYEIPEIARQMNLSVRTVERRLLRIRQVVRFQLKLEDWEPKAR